VSLYLAEGEIVALLGRNGAGKTTTLRSIMGLTPPWSGSIRFLGMELVGRKTHEISRLGIAYVPDDRRIFPDLTVEENLEIAAKYRHKTSNGWTLQKVYELFPILETLRSRKGGTLSGGEQKMLAIGRALMQNPKLLLLDEPSEGLGPIIVRSLIQKIHEIAKAGVTILIADQNLKFCRRVASRGYIMDKGRIVYQGKMEEIWHDKELLSKYITV